MNLPLQFIGVVEGNSIKLQNSIGLRDDQRDTVHVRAKRTLPELSPEDVRARGEHLKKAFGGWADIADEIDEYLALNRKLKQQEVREMVP